MTSMSLLGPALFAALLLLPSILVIVRSSKRRQKRRRGFVLGVVALEGATFAALVLVLSVPGVRRTGTARALPSVVQETPAPVSVEVNAVSPSPADIQAGLERRRGARGGYQLAFQRTRRRISEPSPRVLAAILEIHCRGESDAFKAGFESGYRAGMNAHGEEERTAALAGGINTVVH